MERNAPAPIVIADLRGGRNNTDPPMSLPLNQCVEALNVDWKDATLGRKRGGATAVSITGGTAFGAVLASLLRHVPGASEGAAELWGFDGGGIVKRLTGGTTWADVTLDDAIQSDTRVIIGASLNGKLFLAYNSAQDRLHVYDPNLSSPRVRRVGLTTPVFSTVADTGAGTYAAVARYYRIRWLQMNGSVVVRRSEPSAASFFTPSGTGTHARVTRSTAAGEGETHWEVEVSSDASVWYLLAGRGTGAAGTNLEIAIATTTYDDNTLAASYVNGDAPDVAGTYGLFPSVQFLVTDGNRLLGARAWETSGANSGGKSSRIWFTPVLGSSDQGDDERVPNTATQKNWVDLNENDGGFLTALGGPINGVVFAFKYRQVWKLRPTGDVSTPYLPRKIRDDIGCISHKSIAMGEDQIGRPALYFLSHRGPYRITSDGDVEYLGRDNEDVWRQMNLAATGSVGHSVYYPDLHQWWLFVTLGAADPAVKMMFDVQLGYPDVHGQIRGGWAKHDGDSASSIASVLFSNTLGATMSRDLKPHVSRAAAAGLLKCDTTDLDDGGMDFQAYLTTRPLLTTVDLARKVSAGEPTVIGKALAGSDLTVTINRDFGKETVAKALSLAPTASETRVVKKIEGLEMGEADAIQITIGDSAANEEMWTVDAIIVPITARETR